LKKIYFIFLIILHCLSGAAQHEFIDVLREKLVHAQGNDFAKVLALGDIADYYAFLQFDSCLIYSARTVELSKKINFTYGLYVGYMSTFHGMNCLGNYPEAMQAVFNMEKTAEKLKTDSPWVEGLPYYFSGLVYREMQDYGNAIKKLNESISIQHRTGDPTAEMFASFSQLGIVYMRKNMLDSALKYARIGYALAPRSERFKRFDFLATGALGNVHAALKNFDSARALFLKAIDQSIQVNNVYFQARNYNNLAGLYEKFKYPDSSIWYANRSVELCTRHRFMEFLLDASTILAKLYESKKNQDSAFKYTKMMLAAKDSVFSQSKGREFQQVTFEEIQKLQEANAEKERNQNRVRTYSLVVVLLLLSSLAYILYRNARQRQKDATSIQKAYNELKATQSQLVQSEKMASLGELTAGIAHEIQNPLNFVNNFSEVNQELFDEMETEFKNGNSTEAYSIATNIRQNLEKINQHGKRAESIVKGMLLHSRVSTGQKELTDLNAMAEEYLRLSYHGMRAKDKTFNCEIMGEFDPLIGKINLISQDIGRVLLNLYNNAFYSLAEKAKKMGSDFKPLLQVKTKRTNGRIEINVRDNGLGIPAGIANKVFQPFFTTKPSGQGTGLGLSLAYDIISKEHQGTISVESAEGEYAKFIILLPST
jgi:signal transduction histidine kinase